MSKNMEGKLDFLRECMSDPALVQRPIPIDQFGKAFCIVCAYKPCVRSRANTMLFTERVANWEDRMFRKVPRAPENDERYAQIRGKRFLTVEEPLIVNTDPESVPTVEQPPEAPVHSTPPQPTKPPIQIIPVPPAAAPLVMTQQSPPVAAPHQGEPTLNNTPFQGGIVLPGKPEDKKEDQFVEPGSTFTFGEDE